MPPKDIPITIVKIPLQDSEKHRDYPQVFKLMPLLYLELIENKVKIKQDLINKNYVPPSDISVLKAMTNSNGNKEREGEKEIKKGEKRDKKDNKDKDKDKDKTSHSTPSISDSDDERDERDEKNKRNDSESEKSNSESESEKSDSESDSDNEMNNVKNEKHISDIDENNRSRRTSSSENLSDRLKQLLQNEKDSSQSDSISDKRSDKRSGRSEHSDRSFQSKNDKSSHSKFTPYDKYKKSVEIVKPVPTLAELEQKGKFNITHELRDINQIPMSEYDQDDRKRELLFKFELLKKSYKNISVPIPEVTIHTDLNEMQKLYDGTVRRLSLDSTVENYKNYLMCGFMVTEYFFGSFLGFDMAGFTQEQMINMHSYEKLLIELGEKSYVPTGSKWPVELQLLFLIIVNAGMFIIGKMISHKIGTNLMGMMKNMNTVSNPTMTKQAEPSSQFNRPKRKMKGPDNLEEIQENTHSQNVPQNSMSPA